MQLLRFQPLLRRAVWGGCRLRSELGKELDGAVDIAECWEVADLPGMASTVLDGPLAGLSLRDLMEHRARELLGRHLGMLRFPLAIKFLDVADFTSVQVHPADDALIPPKCELWHILEASPGSRVIAGLQPGVDEVALRRSIERGKLADCVHTVEVKAGDTVLIEPGTVHALGSGILAVAVQQPLETAYRLYDWRRIDAQGRERKLQLDRGLEVVDYQRGPVGLLSPRKLALPGSPEELIDSPAFTVNRFADLSQIVLATDQRAHVLSVLRGTVVCSGGDVITLLTGDTVVLPAERPRVTLDFSPGAVLLDASVP